MQLYNTFRNRWCGAYFASEGMRVIPTVSWGDERSFAFCFEGIPKGSTVAVSTYMVSEHGNRADQKPFFMKGYEELLRAGGSRSGFSAITSRSRRCGATLSRSIMSSAPGGHMDDDAYVPSK